MMPTLIDASGTDSTEIRGIWVVRHNLAHPESIDQIFELSRHLQFTDLFVQIRGRGDAYYESLYEPKAESVDSDFDPLQYLLQHPDRGDFKIHGWMNVFYLWSRERLPTSENHLLHTNPDWLGWPVSYDSTLADSIFTGLRNTEGVYASPMIPEVQQHLLKVIANILDGYRLDGLHFDYIRYPGQSFDFNPAVRDQFQEKFLIDPIEFKRYPDAFIERFGTTGYEIFYARWAEFLREGLNGFVASASQMLRKRHPSVLLSAAVKPDIGSAHWQFYQEWDRWVTEGWLNFAVPMNYTPDNERFLGRIHESIKNVPAVKLLPGISLYNQSSDSAIEKILSVDQLSMPGYVLFSYDQIRDSKQLQEKYLRTLKLLENQQ